MTVLVTGGAGFIGSYVVEALVEEGHEVVVFDRYLTNVVEGAYHESGNLILLDSVRQIVDDWEPDAVIHMASAVGTGISMKNPNEFVQSNVVGTCNLMRALQGNVDTLVLASTVSVYGEGSYYCHQCNHTVFPERSREQLAQAQWEPMCPRCGHVLWLEGTTEDAPLRPRSIYASTKLEQEHLCRLLGEAAGMRVAVARLWNVYGPRQKQDNPYTGVTAMLMGAIQKGEQFTVYEDGGQRRDYVYAGDVAQALIKLMHEGNGVYNVGSDFNLHLGIALGVIAEAMDTTYEDSCVITNQYREGDIRHIIPNVSKIRALGWEPKVRPVDGLHELALAVRNSAM